jgi:hypothetical protein
VLLNIFGKDNEFIYSNLRSFLIFYFYSISYLSVGVSLDGSFNKLTEPPTLFNNGSKPARRYTNKINLLMPSAVFVDSSVSPVLLV